MTGDKPIPAAGLRDDVPTSARSYGWALGGKDNFEVDRQAMLMALQTFPESVDIARENRRFLYRAVRYLARDAGIRQFIDMGCGLPTDNNVHQVAQAFVPDASVVYVDIDPVVLAHGRALLAGNARTTVLQADLRDPEAVLAHPETRRLIDFDRPVAVLFLSVAHHLLDDDNPRRVLRAVIDRAVSGSYLALSQVVSDDPGKGAELSEMILNAGVPWQTRTPAELTAFLDGLEPVDPGVVELSAWRPDRDQPELAPVDEPLEPYVGASKINRRVYQCGGVLRRP
jgi:SAM-dependent methyltransferase